VYDQVKKGRGGARGNTKALTGTNALALDEEAPTKEQTMIQNVLQLCVELREDEYNDKTAEVPATALASLVLKSSPETGIHPSEVPYRQQVFGTNALAERKLDSFCKLCYEAVQDFVLIMLIVLCIISIVDETTYGLDPERNVEPVGLKALPFSRQCAFSSSSQKVLILPNNLHF